jgi:cellulose synthase/poly-beta-1,6-N-acetylglucosamine synthase-like glycosyltransferase
MGEGRPWIARGVFALATGAMVAVGYVTGLGRVPLLGVREAAFAMLSFGGFIALSGLLFARRVGSDPPAPPAETPVTAIVPTYRDAAVLGHSVESLRAADHPVEVVIVCEPDDEAGIRTAERYAEREEVTRLINRTPGTKAGAINDAVARTDAEVYAVFDADQSVPPDFFDRVTGRLRAADVIQTRFLPRSNGLIESLSYYEYTLFNYCFRQPLYALTSFRMATSKALLFTRDAFERVGGYDPGVVSEDNDFGHRCYLSARDVDLCYDTVVEEEVAHSLRDWWGQRKRWMTGNVQVFHRKLLPRLREDYDDPRLYVSLLIGLSSIGGAAFLVSLLPKFAWLLSQGRTLVAAVPLLAVYAVAVYARRRDGLSLGWEWLLLPLVLPFFSLITLAALAEYLTGFDEEWFAIEKGEDEREERSPS